MLVLDNGAYCKRIGRAVDADGPQDDDPAACRGCAGLAEELEAALQRDPSITPRRLHPLRDRHRRSLNPLQAIADVVARHGKGLIVDAMSSFAALPIDAREATFDALVAASGKCLEGVPGMGFVFIRKAVLERCAGNSHSLAMDLYDQHVYMEKTGQWRFTPPTHVVAALAEAMRQFEEEGGQPARGWRATPRTARRWSTAWKALGFEPFLDPAIQAPIIVTFHAPADPTLRRSSAFYDAVKKHGFILYPGKLTEVETFRVGCIGAIGPRGDEQAAVAAVAATMKDLGIASGVPTWAAPARQTTIEQ